MPGVPKGLSCWLAEVVTLGPGASEGVFFFKFFFSTFIYFLDREIQSMNGGGAERQGDTESETGSRL